MLIEARLAFQAAIFSENACRSSLSDYPALPLSDVAVGTLSLFWVRVRSFWLYGSEVDGAVDKIGHVIGRLDRQRMLRKARPGRNILCHLSRHFELSIRAFCQDCDHHVFKRDNPDAELDELRICHVGYFRVQPLRQRFNSTAFVIPS